MLMSMHATCDIDSKTSRNTAHTSLSCLCNCRQDGGSGGGLMNDIWESAKVVFVWEWAELVGTFGPLHSLCIKETDQRRRLNSSTRRGRFIGHHVQDRGPCLSNFLSWVHKLGRIFTACMCLIFLQALAVPYLCCTLPALTLLRVHVCTFQEVVYVFLHQSCGGSSPVRHSDSQRQHVICLFYY